MNTPWRWVVSVGIGIAVPAILAGTACRPAWHRRHTPESEPLPPANVTLALPLQLPSALALIATEKGYFGEQNLNVTVKECVSGHRALEAMLAGDADAATMADVPLVLESFRRADFRILATIATADSDPRVVARMDAGITRPADLRHKRIATQEASAVHFFLHCFLLKHGMADGDVTLSFLEAEQMPAALARGDVDAFAMREPFVTQATALLGTNAVVFDAPGLCYRTEQFVMRAAFLERKPDVACAMLRALRAAEVFARDNPHEAMAIVARKLGTPTDAVSAPWRGLDLNISLDQSLLTVLENEARWAIRSGLTDAEQVPNYLTVIAVDPLSRVKPEAISIIR